MTPRTRMLGGVAIAVVLIGVWFFTRGGPDVAHPLRTAGANSTTTPAAGNSNAGFDAYRMFRTRNVFDPDRRPIRTASGAPPPPPGHADFVALTGTMFNGDRPLAFFSGSRPEYNKVLALNDRIAGAQIKGITPAGIDVDRDGKDMTVAVGQTVPLDGSTQPGAAPAPDGSAASSAGSVAPGSFASMAPARPALGSGSSNSSSSRQDEIRRRLEERRRQEQK